MRRIVLVVLVLMMVGAVVSPSQVSAQSDRVDSGRPPSTPSEPSTMVADPAGDPPSRVVVDRADPPSAAGLSVLDGPGVEPQPLGEARVEAPAGGLDRKAEVKPGAVELVERRTARSDSFRNPDGTYVEVLHSGSKYFDDGKGLVPIDSTLVPVEGSTGSFRNRANAWTVTFSPLGGVGEGVELRTAKGVVSLSPERGGPGRPIAPVVETVDGLSAVRYVDVWPGVDVQYVVGNDGVKENVIVKSKVGARSRFEFLFDGVELAAPTKGRAKDLPGSMVPSGELADEWVVLPPVVFDKAGNVANPVARPQVSAEKLAPGLAKRGEGSKYSLSVDRSWIESLSEADFPIVIDPQLNVGVNVWANYYYNVGSNAYGSEAGGPGIPHRVGNLTVYGNTYYRSVVHYPYEHLLHADPAMRPVVLGANVWFGNYIDTQWNPQTVSASWASTWGYGAFPGYGYVNSAAGTNPGTGYFQYATFDAYYPVAGWFANNTPNGAIVFTGAETPGVGSYKELSTSLHVTYDYRPAAAVGNPSPPNNAIITSAAPSTFGVDQVSTPDGDDVEYRFVFSQFPNMSNPAADSGWFNPAPGSRVSWTPPAGALLQNVNYFWRVESRDVSANLTVIPSPFTLYQATAKLGFDKFSGTFGDVNTLLGNYSFTDVDVSLDSVVAGLASSRTVHSAGRNATGFWGSNETFSLPFMKIAELGGVYNDAIVTMPDGREEYHKYVGNNDWVGPPGRNGDITGINGVPTTLTTGDGVTYESYTGGWIGLLKRITNPFGHQLVVDQNLAAPAHLEVRDQTSGRKLKFFLSGSNRITHVEVAHPSGGAPVTFTFQYDANGNLWKACDPAPNQSICRVYEWEAYAGPWDTEYRIKRAYDRKGQLDFELTYGTTGRVVQVKDALNNTTSFTYYAQDPVTFEMRTDITDQRGNVWVHRFNAQGNFTHKQAPGAPATLYAYDPVTSLRTTITDPNGNTASLVYDSSYRVVAEVNGAGQKSMYVYDEAGNRIKECDGRTPDSNNDNIPDVDTFCTISTYHPPGDASLAQKKKRLLYSRQQPGLPAAVYTYTTGAEAAPGGGTMPAGLKRTYTDPAGVTTTVDYYATGSIAKEFDTTGKDLRWTYDGWGRKLTQSVHSNTYPSGVTTTFTYDLVGNLLTETGPVTTNAVTGTQHQLRTTHAYDNNRNRVSSTLSDLIAGGPARVTHYGYDLLDREYQVTDAEGGVLERRFDAAGNVTFVKDPASRWMKSTYNVRNEVVQLESLGVLTTPPANSATGTIIAQTVYDNAGRKTRTIDALGRTIETTFDGADRPVKVVQLNYRDDTAATPRNVVLSRKTYDGAGNVTTLQEGGTDGAGWVPARTTSYGYDPASRLITTTLHGVNGANNRVTTRTLDARGDVLTENVSQGGVPAGGVSAFEKRRAYDGAGRVVCETVENGTTDLITRTSYDTRGSVISTTPPRGNTSCTTSTAGFTTTVVNDQLGRPVQTTSPSVNVETNGGTPTAATPTTKIGYNAFGEATHAQDANGNVTTTTYDRLGRRVSIIHPTYTPPGGAAVTPSETFGYDAVGNLTASTNRRGFTTTFEYDAFNRLRYQRDPADPNGGPTVLLADSFTAANGTAWDAAKWTTELRWGGAIDVQANAGRMWVNGGVNWAARSMAPASSNHTDAEATAKVTFSSTGDSGVMVWLRGSTNWNSVYNGYLHNGYYLRLDLQTNKVLIRKAINGTDPSWCGPGVNCTIAEVPYTLTPNTTYNTKFKVVGSNLYAKVWTGGSEPTGWTLTGSDTTFSSGRAALSFDVWDSQSRTATWDDYNLVSLAGGGAAPGGVTEHTYDLVGNRTSTIDPTGAVTNATYDDRNRARSEQRVVRAVTVTPAAGASGPTTPQTIPGGTYVTVFDHNDLSQQVKVTSPHGVYTQRNINAAGEVTATTDNDNKTVTITRDVMGNEIRVTDPLGRQIRHDYDPAGRRVATGAFANNATTTAIWRTETTYDTAGNAVATKTPLGVVNNYATTYTYDALNRLTAQTQPIAAGSTITTTYGYDAASNPTRFTDGRSNAFITTYTPWNLPQDTIEPSTTAHPALTARTFTRVYDAGGLPVQERQPGSVTINHTFDHLGRLTQQSSGSASRSFGYDLAGRRTSVSHPNGSLAFVHDDRSLLVGATGPAGNTIATYDGDGRLLTRNDPAGSAAFTWTNQNELATLTEPLTGRQFIYSYNDARQATQVDYGTGPNGTVARRLYTYDNAGRLATDRMRLTPASTLKYSTTYTYDADSNITREVIDTLHGVSGTVTYDQTYDRQGRITQFKRSSGSTVVATTNYGWDASGNRVSAGGDTWSYDARNRIIAGPEGTYVWEARGALDSVTAAGGAVTDHVYDGLGRLTGHTASGTTTTYSYDALDRVAARNGVVFSYSGVGLDPAAVGAGATAQRYSRTPAGRLAAVKDGANAAVLAGLNGHGDLRWTFEPAGAGVGNTVASRLADPFGAPHAVSGSTVNVGFQGDYTDPATGEVWMGARWYRPASARFGIRDTYAGQLSTPVSLNRYTYAHGNPLKYFDPDGRCVECGEIAGWWSYAEQLGYSWEDFVGENQQYFDDWTARAEAERRHHAVRQQIADDEARNAEAERVAAELGAQQRQSVPIIVRIEDVPGEVRFIIANTTVVTPELIVEQAGLCGADPSRGIGRNGDGNALHTLWGRNQQGVAAMCGAWQGAQRNLPYGGFRAMAGFVYQVTVGDLVDCARDPDFGSCAMASVDIAATLVSAGAAKGLKAASIGSRIESAVDAARYAKALEKSGDELATLRRLVDDCAVNSFTGDTTVLLADGSRRAIRDITIGDHVIAADPVTGVEGPRRVTRLIRGQGDKQLVEITIDTPDREHAVIVATDGHPFWVPNRNAWINAADLEPGDTLQGLDDTTVTVASTRSYAAHTTVYNLTVEDIHTYHVHANNHPILVHNCTNPQAANIGSGNAYSVGFETRLSTSSFPGSSRAAHFQEANSSLLKAMDADETFARSMHDMIPGIRDQLIGPRGGVSRSGPTDWTWHHAQQPGVMQLVPTSQHTAPGALQGLLHPDGRGGMAIWG